MTYLTNYLRFYLILSIIYSIIQLVIARCEARKGKAEFLGGVEMEKKLWQAGDDVIDGIYKAQAALAEYAFFGGNREGMAKDADISRIRDLLNEASYLSRMLVDGWMK